MISARHAMPRQAQEYFHALLLRRSIITRISRFLKSEYLDNAGNPNPVLPGAEWRGAFKNKHAYPQNLTPSTPSVSPKPEGDHGLPSVCETENLLRLSH